MIRSTKQRIAAACAALSITVGGVAASSTLLASATALTGHAKHGADDPADHGKHGADDPVGHGKHGADDPVGHGKHGADDPVGHG